jgi:hypothetical protein
MKRDEVDGSPGFQVTWTRPCDPRDKETVRALIQDIRRNKDHAFNRPEAVSHDLAVAEPQTLYKLLDD